MACSTSNDCLAVTGCNAKLEGVPIDKLTSCTKKTKPACLAQRQVPTGETCYSDPKLSAIGQKPAKHRCARNQNLKSSGRLSIRCSSLRLQTIEYPRADLYKSCLTGCLLSKTRWNQTPRRFSANLAGPPKFLDGHCPSTCKAN